MPTFNSTLMFFILPLQCTLSPPTTHTERQITFQTHTTTFYRPTSRIIRDLSILAVTTLPSHSRTAPPYTVLDAYSASGIRALRYLSPPCPVSHVTANDTHSLDKHVVLLHNLRAHILCARATVLNARAEHVLQRHRAHVVDLDLFGACGEPVIGAAVEAVRKGGLLYLCATDARAGSGGNPRVAYAAYGAATVRMPAGNEQFLRLVMGGVLQAGMARGRSCRPVFSYFHRESSTARVMVLMDCECGGVDDVGFVGFCRGCGEIAVGGLSEVGRVAVCGGCGGVAEVGGPIWVGELHDRGFLEDMREVGIGMGREWEGVVRLVQTLIDECGMKPFYYLMGQVGKRIGGSLPKFELIREELRAVGGDCVKAHARPRCLKVTPNVQLNDVVGAARKAAERVRGGHGLEL